MEELFPWKESHVDGFLASLGDDPQSPRRPRRSKKQSSPLAKKHGNRVLIVGSLRELALYRAEFLRQAGFTVSVAEELYEAIRMMQRGAFDAIVLSYTLPDDTAQYVADMARDYCADCPVVVIVNSSMPGQRIEPDAVAHADEGPIGLIAALNRVLELG